MSWGEEREPVEGVEIGSFEKFSLPLVKKVVPKLIASSLVSVQPMSAPMSSYKPRILAWLDENHFEIEQPAHPDSDPRYAIVEVPPDKEPWFATTGSRFPKYWIKLSSKNVYYAERTRAIDIKDVEIVYSWRRGDRVTGKARKRVLAKFAEIL